MVFGYNTQRRGGGRKVRKREGRGGESGPIAQR